TPAPPARHSLRLSGVATADKRRDPRLAGDPDTPRPPLRTYPAGVRCVVSLGALGPTPSPARLARSRPLQSRTPTTGAPDARTGRPVERRSAGAGPVRPALRARCLRGCVRGHPDR